MKNASGEDMGASGQVTRTFTINNQPFTQSFIVCRHMQRPVILGADFTSTNFVGIIWTREGTRKMIRSNGSMIMELSDMTSGVPLVLARSVKIRPGGNLEVPLECTRQLTDQMDIRIDTGFHHRNPNIYIPPCCINNPNNKHNPRYMPLTIFNLSTVDHLYIGKDTVITFAEQPVLETYNIELAGEDKIEEHLAKPRNWVHKNMRLYLRFHMILPFFALRQMCQDPVRCNCRIKILLPTLGGNLRNSVMNMEKLSPRTTRTSAGQNLSRWT